MIVVILVILITGVVVALYFYSKNFNDNNTDGVIENVDDFIQLSLKNNETKYVVVSGKKLSLELKDNVVYLNNKNLYSSDIDIENVPNNITITKEMILIVKTTGQFGNEYSFYDLNGNEIKYVSKPAQFNNLKNEDEKLKVDAFIFENQWMGGYKIGNIMTINDTADCSGKRLKDYPNIVEEHKNDVLDADYYFYLSGNEVTLKYDKVLLTVGDLDLNTCVMEEGNNQGNNNEIDIRKQLESIEDKYLFALYGYTDLSGIDNQSIMKAILVNSSFYPSNSFTKEQLDNELQNSVLSKLSIKHEDFWFNGYNTDVAPTYSYDEKTGTYKSNPVGKGACRVSPAYKKVIDYSYNNGEYIIKFKYIWYYGCEGTQPDTWYGNYMNAKNKQNSIFVIDISKYDHGILPSNAIKNEAEKNWQSIEEKLDIYTYTFKYENNRLVLTNFRRTES